jgi:alpha-galactosidase
MKCLGSDFHTPEAVLSRSKFGLGGVSRTLSRLYNDHLLPRTWADDDPPILINTWETMYYDVNYDALVDLAYKAVSVGINLLVLDDGWFGNRHDDTSSLGDWVLNKSKFPGGLRNLVSKINSMGLKFGIWIEPEMISEDSNLFREHPDWCLHVPGRVKQVGRNQLVLDIGNPLIRDYVCDEIAALLKSANIEYIKWDMNRPLTAVYTQREGQSNVMSQNSRPFSYACSGYQDETSHRYMLGVYEMLYRIRRDFPNVLLETSASGGYIIIFW